jgi:hypothetical protein
MKITVDGPFVAVSGDIIKIPGAFQNSPDWLSASRIKNLTSGASANYGGGIRSTPWVDFNPPLIAKVVSAVQHSGSSELEVECVTKEVFLSYSTADKHLAGEVARGLGSAGLTVFQAHDGIGVSVAWRREIHSHLDSCVLLIAVVTENYNSAAWPNQETGYGIAKNKHVVPVIVNRIALKGLVEELQGVPLDTTQMRESVSRLISRYASNSLSSSAKALCGFGSWFHPSHRVGPFRLGSCPILA